MKKGIILCPHCQKPVTPSETNGYTWQCLDCDEDFYDFECYRVSNGAVPQNTEGECS